jgi:EpsD family peptidyl-prolyl cis-trans isomerase
MYLHLKNYSLVGSLILVGLVTLGVAGCGKKDKTATQVVASVDGEEITVQQINNVLNKSRGVTPENLTKAKADILGGLVDQQIAINLAISKKLDRTPEVVAALEAARREILARAALEQIAAAQEKPSDEDAKKYYLEKPELFSARRIFNLQEIALGKNISDVDQLRNRVANSKSMEELIAWLKSQNIQYAANAGSRPAEQVPLDVLPKLHQLKDGQIDLIEGKEGYLIMRVIASALQPVTEVQALPTIKMFLANQRGAEAVKLAQNAMKAKAKIEYFGEFSGGEAALKAKAEADSIAAVQAAESAKIKARLDAEATAKVKADDQAASLADQEARSKARAEARALAEKDKPTSSTTDAANLEKGLKGLK